MLRFKIYHKKTEWDRNKMRNDRVSQKNCGEVNTEDKNSGKIFKSKKPPRRRVHTCSAEYDRVQAEKSVHRQYVYSKEAWCKVDSEKLSWEKPKSHRTEKSGKTVVIISIKNREKRISGIVFKCKNLSNAQYRILSVKANIIVTLRKLLQWKNYGVTIPTRINLIATLNVFRINLIVNGVNLKIGLLKSDSEKGSNCKTEVSLNFRKIIDNCILLKEQNPKRGLRIKGTVARESRRRFLLNNRKQKGMALGEIFHGNITVEFFTTNDV
jgi:hypothetical protein